jgi:acyl-CoA thioesterase I
MPEALDFLKYTSDTAQTILKEFEMNTQSVQKKIYQCVIPLILALAFPLLGQTIISCAGTSVTMSSQYPEVLQKLLGSSYKVYDEGAGGSDAGYGWNHFVATTNFAHIVAVKPQVVALEFGANDAHAPADWIDANFYSMYSKFVDTFYTISPKPKVFVIIPPPMFVIATTPPQNVPFVTSLEHIVVQLRKLVADRNLPYLDFNTPLLGHPEYTSDGCHMLAQGIAADTMAHIFYRALMSSPTSASSPSRISAKSNDMIIDKNGLLVNVAGNVSWTLTFNTLDGKKLSQVSGIGKADRIAFNKDIRQGTLIARLQTNTGVCASVMVQSNP